MTDIGQKETTARTFPQLLKFKTAIVMIIPTIEEELTANYVYIGKTKRWIAILIQSFKGHKFEVSNL